MTHPQMINTPTDEELSDIRAYDQAIEQLAKGQDEMIPSEFADRMLEGESAVRVWREYRKLSVKELAGQANISASYLSQIEGGSRAGSLPAMQATVVRAGRHERRCSCEIAVAITPPLVSAAHEQGFRRCIQPVLHAPGSRRCSSNRPL